MADHLPGPQATPWLWRYQSLVAQSVPASESGPCVLTLPSSRGWHCSAGAIDMPGFQGPCVSDPGALDLGWGAGQAGLAGSVCVKVCLYT